jgi:hypothetical protein
MGGFIGRTGGSVIRENQKEVVIFHSEFGYNFIT